MRKYILLIAFFSSWNFLGQISLTGESYYMLDIEGYMGRGKGACGSIDGLREVNVFYVNGTSARIFDGRLIHANTNFSKRFTKQNKINKVIFKVIIRWKNGLGNCDGGPRDRFKEFSINTDPYSHYQQNLGDGFDWVSLKTKAFVEINVNATQVYELGSEGRLEIKLADHIESKYYNWKYRVGNGPALHIPQAFNNTDYLNLKGKDFLPQSAEGQMVSVWADTESGGTISNTVNFTYFKSSPNFVGVSDSKTSCYDNNDAVLKVYTDRDLLDGETLSLTYFNLDTQRAQANYVNLTIDDFEHGVFTTPAEFPKGSYGVTASGFYNGQNTHSNSLSREFVSTVDKNDPVDFMLSKIDVWCFGGNDGIITLNASGGVTDGVYQYQLNEGDWVNFSNQNNHQITGLTAATYTLKVRDANGCIAKIQGEINGEIALGEEKVQSISLTQPMAPLSLEYTLNQEPTFYGGANGKIVVKIDGGTRFENNSYSYEWRNQDGVLLNQQSTAVFTSGSYYITLNNVAAGTYFLTVKDKNYELATNKVSCLILESELIVTQPDPLKVKFILVKPISCHDNNEFGDETDQSPQDGIRDEVQDGSLKVIAEGGRPFTGTANNGLPYIYTWKKQNSAGQWDNLAHITSETAIELSDGNYAVNIEDRNGIQLGVYQNNELQTVADSLYNLKQPDQLTLYFEKKAASCNNSHTGWAKVFVQGGTPPYTYNWSNGATTAAIDELISIPYFVEVIDARGCRVEGTVVIDQPDAFSVQEHIRYLDCYNATDAFIKIDVSGGVLPYTYQWNTGQITSDLENLAAGTYIVEVTDAQGCSFKKQYTISNPDEFTFEIGEDRTLCNSQYLPVDIAIADDQALYKWESTNGFESESPQVVLRQEGLYTATITTSKGCVATAQIRIDHLSIPISSEFLISTQAYVSEEVVLVNVSKPFGEQTNWLVPEGIEIVEIKDETLTLRFEQTGEYEIGLKQTQGACYQIFNKKIVVENRDDLAVNQQLKGRFIEEFSITPNPNRGEFVATIILAEESPIQLRLINYIGQNNLMTKKLSGNKKYVVPIEVNVAAGTYILILETGKQTLTQKMIIL
ncbi:T9SS type A sorting domain-containing protein [Flavobacterium sp. NKUCC04_CG]|uniref:T9SS type A sorting domain-containing protein n=1 Tax=Flavobacterium sp. NKUCC04_CG TaxID=2842121 RepID=UPI001C5BA709|nr:T9SS type A sorting domain-containing protein [Flavobacterium sp. NKUCC04_CG]MBW3520007.1 T9SS type A sorting domain-containing protein [Flavobacterium sp. NKUCC04_CG]